MKEYRKTYQPLILWCLLLLPVMLSAVPAAGWLGWNERAMIALMMAFVVVMLLVLFWMIWKGEHVYWINGGPSFEEAKAAGSEARRDYAWKHFAAILKGSLAAMVLLAAGCFFGVHEIVIVLLAGVCIVAAALSTIRIEWTVSKNDPEN